MGGVHSKEKNYSIWKLGRRKSDLTGFEIADGNKDFIPAKAQIVGDKIEVSTNEINKPKHVRYAWKDFIIGSLFNNEGLPAASFSTEE